MTTAATQTQLTIERLSKLGEGVAHLQGRTVFVEGALPGERIVARVEPSGKVLRGEILELLEKSPARRPSACPLANACGGCDWLHVDEAVQRAEKEEILLSALEHLGGISREGLRRAETLVSPRNMGYRRRAVLHVTGRALGFFGRRSHECVPVSDCPALVPALAPLPGRLSEHLGPIAKDLELVALLAEGQKVSFAAVLKGAARPKHGKACERAVRALCLAGAVVVPHEGSPQLVGKPALEAISPLRPEVPLYLRPDAFAQANGEANLALVTAAVYLLGAQEADRVLELYSGNGNFTFPLAGTAMSVTAIESSGVGIELAQRAAREGGVRNVRFVQGDVSKVCRGLVEEGARFDLLLLDPPRTGATGVAGLASRLSVRRVVYVSCDPASLSRDAAELVSRGFKPGTVQLIDMFPQTRHVEAVMSFDRA